MKGKDLISGMSFVDERFINEAETKTISKSKKVVVMWRRWGTVAACLAVAVVTAFYALPNFLNGQNNIAPPSNANNNNSVISVSSDSDNDKNTSSAVSEIHISLKNVFLNEIGSFADAARRWYDPELYDNIDWDKNDIIDYYGKDLTPAYIPNGLIAAPGNGTAKAIADKNGNIIEDTVYFEYYHAYYEDGSPKLTDDVAAVKGFSVAASKVGLLHDCLYIVPDNEVKTTDIAGVSVKFGYCSTPYGPYAPETHEPSGYYNRYVVEFKLDGTEYQIIADQMELEETVKVVSSVICKENAVIDK